jgi:hypothetical protein
LPYLYHGRKPRLVYRESDVVVASGLATNDARLRVVGFLAVGHHAWLCGLGRLDAVSCTCGWSGCCLDCCTSDNAYTHVDVWSHTRAVVLDSWVPLHEIGESDLLETNDLSTRHACGDPMELRTVRHHSRLCGLWGCDNVSWGGTLVLDGYNIQLDRDELIGMLEISLDISFVGLIEDRH